ncbi:hypothetical protein DEW08_10645 [Azospirillum thermophilum]|uniref:HEPN domain-containing protein n=1 Tax=Azospirillum thermophilum TaxID=2202148 RepID=A0A2S2CQA5_9PROT|nr:hypothetical protein DEW08_10645 [Azospirillum thermophilum]
MVHKTGVHKAGADRWLAVAQTDLLAARACLGAPGPLVTVASYHCQQAAEKLVKAVLVRLDIDPPKSHDIDALLLRLPRDLPLRRVLEPLGRFTAFATLYRYPGEAEDSSDEPTPGEVASWIVEIDAVLAEVRHVLGAPPEPGGSVL